MLEKLSKQWEITSGKIPEDPKVMHVVHAP